MIATHHQIATLAHESFSAVRLILEAIEAGNITPEQQDPAQHRQQINDLAATAGHVCELYQSALAGLLTRQQQEDRP